MPPKTWQPIWKVGDVVHHSISLRQGTILEINNDKGVVDIQFDKVQKPGVIYENCGQNKAKVDGHIDRERRMSAFKWGENDLPGVAVVEDDDA